MMGTGNSKYEELIEILRKSPPELNEYKSLEDRIMNSISSVNRRSFDKYEVIQFMFGWTYTGWIRYTLATACIILVVFFVWQQRTIISEINDLKAEFARGNREMTYDPSRILEQKSILNLMKEEGFSSGMHGLKLFQLLQPQNVLRGREKEILQLINDDPELKAIVERKLKEHNIPGIKL